MGLKSATTIFEKFNIVEIEWGLDSFIEYLNLTNKLVEDRLKTDIKAYESSDEESQHYCFDFSDIYTKQQSLDLHYSSMIISLYSFLERTLLKMAQTQENFSKFKIEEQGGEVFLVKTYLENVKGIDFKTLNAEWGEIKRLNKLRNFFVHNSISVLDESYGKGKFNSIKGMKYIKLKKLDEGYYVSLDDQLIKYNIEIVRKFLTDLYYYRLGK